MQPPVWGLVLQRDVALSLAEAECNAMSESLRPTTHMMGSLAESKSLGWTIATDVPAVKCKVLEDNSGALEMARLPKVHPRTKHINVKMDNFREHVKLTTTHKAKPEHQLADTATKPRP